MTLGEDIKQKRAAILGCDVILFGDLRTETVLFAAAAPGLRQEDHDALLAEACHCLHSIPIETQNSFFGTPGVVINTMRITPGRMTVFVRQPLDPSEVYCAAANDPETYPEVMSALIALVNRNAA